ncbi:MAG: aminoacyl-histidine dipeptidase [Lachnospiraceae bacterium]|nr:aminoacyl-histidine dipeptidase [Lachnospiraceae bacterium]
MAVLENLEPKAVFHYFEELSHIPHGSGNTKAISDYFVNFAKERGLEYYQDALNNVIIIKEATEGYEAVPPIMIQGHMDMVAVAEKDCPIDMTKEGIRLAVCGDQVYAKGTTLGADDGIAVAYALAILDADDIAHPRLEVVLTVEEEVGMDGAREIDLSMCRAKRMLNLDTEEEGYLLAGCAGGATFQVHIPLSYQVYEGMRYQLRISGLKGGHSGTEIHKELGNANLLLARVIGRLMKQDGVHLVSMDGGKKDNAIPHLASAILLVEKKAEEMAMEEYKKAQKEILSELRLRDPDAMLDFDIAGEDDRKAIEDGCAANLLALIQVMPRGVCAMSPAAEGLVETSLNLGVLTMTEDEVRLGYAVRSSIGSAKEELLERMKLVCEAYHVSWELKGVYPGWEYQKESVLRDMVCRIYREMYGKDMVVQAIHAGVECGFFAEKIEGLDCVSFGPDIKEAHTPRENLSIASTGRVYRFLLKLLAMK